MFLDSRCCFVETCNRSVQPNRELCLLSMHHLNHMWGGGFPPEPSARRFPTITFILKTRPAEQGRHRAVCRCSWKREIKAEVKQAVARQSIDGNFPSRSRELPGRFASCRVERGDKAFVTPRSVASTTLSRQMTSTLGEEK